MITRYFERRTHVRRDPFQLWVLAACFLSGVVGLLRAGVRTGTIDRLLPAFAANLWFVGLLVSASVCLAALVIPVPYGLLVERIGLLLLGSLLVGYGFALLLSVPGIPTGVLLLSLAGACADRAWWIHLELRDLRKTIKRMIGESEE